MDHWIIAPVVVPACLGGLIVLLMRHDILLQRVFSIAGTALQAGIALALLLATTWHGPEAYFLGNWPAPFGIVLMADRLSALFLLLTAVLALVAQAYAVGSGWDRKGAHFHALWQFQLMGLNGAFLTADAFNLFVFFEVLLIASYGLMVHGGGRDRARAGLQYVAINLIGSTLFLFALALIYALTGTLNMADLAGRIAAMPAGDMALVRVAAVLLFLVFAVKGALVPLQFWLPGTYAHAPGVVAALFAVMTKVGAYAIIRFGTLVFPAQTPATDTLIADLLFPAALVTLVLGAVGVLGARDLPRLVAFAAIASMGTLFVAIARGIGAGDAQATAAALYYAVHSTLAAALLFLTADLLLRRRGDGRLTAQPAVAGSGLIAVLFMAGAVAMAGMPPLSGFVGKLMVMQALADRAALVWSVILLTSLATMIGFARAGSVLFWKTADPKGHEAAPATAPMAARPPETLSLAAIMALVAALAVLTVMAGPISGWMQGTATALHDPAAYIAANALQEVP